MNVQFEKVFAYPALYPRAFAYVAVFPERDWYPRATTSAKSRVPADRVFTFATTMFTVAADNVLFDSDIPPIRLLAPRSLAIMLETRTGPWTSNLYGAVAGAPIPTVELDTLIGPIVLADVGEVKKLDAAIVPQTSRAYDERGTIPIPSNRLDRSPWRNGIPALVEYTTNALLAAGVYPGLLPRNIILLVDPFDPAAVPNATTSVPVFPVRTPCPSPIRRVIDANTAEIEFNVTIPDRSYPDTFTS
jgi:hypothetical protein